MTSLPPPNSSSQLSDRSNNRTLAFDPSHIRIQSHVHEYLCPSEPDRAALGRHSVFAGGGITNCPDWQAAFSRGLNLRLAQALPDHDPQGPSKLSVLNPRRFNFPYGDPTATPFQIAWEHRYLKQTGAISMWFPKDSEGPISLFEAGRWLLSPKPFFLGIEPGYPREQELRTTVRALRPGQQIVNDLELHIDSVANWALGNAKFSLPRGELSTVPGTIYLAGGITGCPDWQGEVARSLTGPELTVVNPRRTLSIESPTQLQELVSQNRSTLDACESVLLWFPKDQITPIALLELGSLLPSSRPLFIGVEPGYRREMDVEIQTQLERPEIRIATKLDELSAQVRAYYSAVQR